MWHRGKVGRHGVSLPRSELAHEKATYHASFLSLMRHGAHCWAAARFHLRTQGTSKIGDSIQMAWLSTYLDTYRACAHVYTYLHTYVHAYMPTDIHIYAIYTYTYTYTRICTQYALYKAELRQESPPSHSMMRCFPRSPASSMRQVFQDPGTVLHIHVCIHICVCVYTYIYAYVYVYIYIYLSLSLSLCLDRGPHAGSENACICRPSRSVSS